MKPTKHHINNLSDYVLELIFTNINVYNDFNNILCVNKRWNRVGKITLTRMKRFFYNCTNFSWQLLNKEVTHSHLLSERCSHAICYHPNNQAMYMYGGCTNTYTAFNDLWLFDLPSRIWKRVIISRPPLPSAKALSTLVFYNNNLILYGGFSKSSINPINQTTTFYEEIHLYNSAKNCWEEIVCENTAPHLAGHTASVVGNFMLVFGGSMGSSYNNDVFVLDIQRRIWDMPSINGLRPPARYGQSQILLDNQHLVIIGGCGGPSVMFCDVWLLEFDLYGNTEWKWTQLKVENLNLSPPYLWCHQACKVGNNAIVLSRPTKFNIKRLRPRYLCNQETNNRILCSPDSLQDRRAVAAIISNKISQKFNEHSKLTKKNFSNKPVVLNCKPVLINSRSLDEQNKNNKICFNEKSTLQNQLLSDKSYTNSSFSNNLYSNSIPQVNNSSNLKMSKLSDLHRARSIPAIIFGEIPKLIVTSSNDIQPKNINEKKFYFFILQDNNLKLFRNQCFDKISTSNLSNYCSQHCSTSSNNELQKNNLSLLDNSETKCSVTNKFGHTAAVREFYLSLLEEEHNRLKIVELAENLQLNEKLNSFLRKRVPYMTTEERLDIINEHLKLTTSILKNNNSFLRNRQCQGRLNNLKEQEINSDKENSLVSTDLINNKYLNNLSSNNLSGKTSTSKWQCLRFQKNKLNSKSVNPEHTAKKNNAFAQIYFQHMCVYVLHLNNAIKVKTVRWEQLPVEENSPQDIILYSIVAAKGELILFGGMQSDGGNEMDCLNVNMNRHLMNSDTFILRPPYNEM